MDFAARESHRVDSENFVSYNMLDEQGRIIQAGLAKTIDISRTGMALQSREELKIGAKLDLAMGVGDAVVKISGIVRNQKKVPDSADFYIGIEFDFIANDALDKLSLIYPDILK